PRGIYPPRSVFKQLTARPHVMLNQYSAATQADPIELSIQPLPSFDTDAKRAVLELAELASTGGDVRVLCRNPAERQRLLELLDEHAADATARPRVEVGYLHRGFVWGKRDGAAGSPDAGAAGDAA